MRDYLKELRQKKGMTQEEAAFELGISQGFYSLIEKGERKTDLPVSMAEKFAALFDVPLEFILKNERK